jgi:hypothetical protein
VRTEVVFDKREREVDAGGDTGRGPHVVVVDEDRIRVDMDAGEAAGELVAVRPMRSRSAVVEEASGREQVRPRAHGHGAACAAGRFRS